MNLNLFSIAGLILSTTCFCLTFVIFYFGKAKLHRIWALFNITVGLWGMGAFFIGMITDKAQVLSIWRVVHIPIAFIPIFMFHMIYILCNLRSKIILYCVYVQGVIFSILSVTTKYFIPDVEFVFNSFYYDKGGPLFYLFFMIWGLIVGYSHFKLFSSYLHSTGKLKSQILYLLIGSGLGFSGGITNFLPVFGINLYPIGNFTIPVYCFISSYAILRHRLMDINVVIRKSMVYSIVAGILTSLFVIIVLALTKLLSNVASDVAGVTSFILTVIAALIIAILFNPLKDKIQSFIDRSFYKKPHDYYPTIRNISRKLTTIFDLDELFNYVGDVIFSTLGLRNIYLLHTAPGGSYEIVYFKSIEKAGDGKTDGKPEIHKHDLKMEKMSEIVRFFGKSDEILIKDELPGFERVLGQESIDCIKSELQPFHGEAVVPVFTEKKLMLVLILGEKESGYMFTNEDINLLNIVANQISVAVRNAQLYSDKVHSERLASIGMMSATFAHEVRNPLTSLKTFAQLMPEKYNDEEFRNYFSKIVEGDIDKIDGLIRDLLDFSTKKKSSRSNNFNLVSLVDETVEYVKGKLDFESKNINIEKNYGNNVIEMSGDATNLKQAFINIITNGCQAMNGEGMLKVHINPDGNNVDVAITDTGEGIHPDDISKIFDPFVTTKEMGIGLGLAISKRIVEDHKGSITVKSQLLKGTTFTISLPVQN